MYKKKVKKLVFFLLSLLISPFIFNAFLINVLYAYDYITDFKVKNAFYKKDDHVIDKNKTKEKNGEKPIANSVVLALDTGIVNLPFNIKDKKSYRVSNDRAYIKLSYPLISKIIPSEVNIVDSNSINTDIDSNIYAVFKIYYNGFYTYIDFSGFTSTKPSQGLFIQGKISKKGFCYPYSPSYLNMLTFGIINEQDDHCEYVVEYDGIDKFCLSKGQPDSLPTGTIYRAELVISNNHETILKNIMIDGVVFRNGECMDVS